MFRQLSLFDAPPEARRDRTLTAALDRIRERYGEKAVRTMRRR